MKHIFFFVLLIGAAAFAPADTFAKETIGGYVVEFDHKLEADTDGNGTNDRTSYYLGDRLMWSAYDEDGNGEADLWLRYRNGDTVDLEITDKNGDREADTIAEYNTQEKREVIFDAGQAESSSWTNSVILGFIVGIGAWQAWNRKEELKKLAQKALTKLSAFKR